MNTPSTKPGTPVEPPQVPGSARPNGRKAGDATRDRMLDAAEILFALHGFHGTSMREVAQQSEARLALVAYHFGTKEALFDRVVERRASYMAHQRLQLLDAARDRAGDGPIPLEELVAGYVSPFVERSSKGGRGWKHYALLVARASNAPDYAKVIGVHYNAVARLFLAEFSRALPEVQEERIFHAFSFMVGTMLSLVAEPGRIESLSSGRYASRDLERVFSTMLPFLTAGFSVLASTNLSGSPLGSAKA
ncbi:TetR family transcriptional regulator [Hydrogenophaga sp. SNF1]|uniref:TetR/AcrR family transcriptional regulator n=1 Tax=Hydrogenophaga sp. SNF1 TaxID=3098762 RepID=UPI002ACC37A3|nr:TetR family transcriptional regulator [Hydrogenophaga sp. SNF1]WQB85239.1 TetR family transcriptional regulator [Hydrogenophaga sp. SNF1]